MANFLIEEMNKLATEDCVSDHIEDEKLPKKEVLLIDKELLVLDLKILKRRYTNVPGLEGIINEINKYLSI